MSWSHGEDIRHPFRPISFIAVPICLFPKVGGFGSETSVGDVKAGLPWKQLEQGAMRWQDL